jgi:hypothetical protein
MTSSVSQYDNLHPSDERFDAVRRQLRIYRTGFVAGWESELVRD